MPMQLINQDRDQISDYTGNLHTEAALSPMSGNIIGFNLYDGEVMLGTFDSVRECIREIGLIGAADGEYYCISGYEPWMDWDDFCKILEWEADDDGIEEKEVDA
jgi:hypothetical protein